MKSIILVTTIILGLNLYAQDEIANANVSVMTYENDPIPGAQIYFKDTESDKIFVGVSDELGKFNIGLPAGAYTIQFKSIGKEKDYKVIEIPTLGENEEYGTVEIVIHYVEETTFTLSNLHFETGKSIIKPESFNELDELVNYMELKPEIKIEVAGHTDNEGSDDSNLILSDKRASAVRDYLISKGIDPNRIVSNGYGESKPIADNESAEGRAQNRRTEIHILEK